MIWNKVPFLRILLPFILGIWLSTYLPGNTVVALWITAFTGCLFALSTFIKSLQFPFKFQWFYGLLLNLCLCGFGYTLTTSHSSFSNASYYAQYLQDDEQGIIVKVLKSPDIKEKSVHIRVEVENVYNGASWDHTLGRGILYMEPDSLSRNLQVGDRCMALVHLEKIKKPSNPGAFDYANYLSHSDIFFGAYASSESWTKISDPAEFNLLRTLNSFKKGLKKLLVEKGMSEEAQAVISALTLGDKNELSPELKSAYSKAGVLHILAVSGLHVGIIYLVLNFLFGFLLKLRKGVFFKALIILLLLWAYAMLTGMSPSVARAATMFSFVIIGTSLNKFTNIYNTLCVSAFVLLLFDPASLYNVGFLLSYTAVVGIVYLYPKINGMMNPRNWLLDKIWVLMSVSLAAQIATFPLSLYYFHQFPNYFLLANLVVVPLATGIIYLSLLLFATGQIPFLGDLIANLVDSFVTGLNLFVHWIESLPYSVTNGIDISKAEVLLIYAVIGMFVVYLSSFKKLYLYLGLIIILGIGSIQIVEQRHRSLQQQLVVYDISKYSCFDVINATTSNLTLDSALINNQRALGFATENNWRQLGIREFKEHSIEKKLNQGHSIGNVIRGFRVLYPVGYVGNESGKKVKVDFLILSKRCKATIEELESQYEIGLIILDSSIPKYRLEKLVDECTSFSILYYNIAEQGAFVRDF